jgi:hypothetical protein
VAFQQGMQFKAYTCDLAVSWQLSAGAHPEMPGSQRV